jgi:hypothetical protein
MNLDKPIILDDVIPKRYQSEIESLLTQNEFDWYLNKSLSYGENPITKAFKKMIKTLKTVEDFFTFFYLMDPQEI